MSRAEPHCPCEDCGCDTISDSGEREWYMVREGVWWSAGMDEYGGYLCIGCLEDRLGRELWADDFTDVPVNLPHSWWRDSPRLAARKAAIIEPLIRPAREHLLGMEVLDVAG